jgi:gluconolactonase
VTEAVTTRRLEQVVEVDAHEGPVYVAGEHALYFTSLPRGLRVDIRRLDLETGEVTTVREDANMANGMTLLPDGRLLVCEQGTMLEPARLSAFDLETAETEPIVDGWRGNALNSPNDVVVAPDGAIWFTDPSYGFLQGFLPQPQSGDYVYRHDPATGETTVVADSFDKPNGLALSPDGSVLYVGDSGANHEVGTYDPTRPHHVIAFD